MTKGYLKLIVLLFCINFLSVFAQQRAPEAIINKLIIRNINIIVKIVEEYAMINNGCYPQAIKDFIQMLPVDFKNPFDTLYEAITEKELSIPAVVIYKFNPLNGYEITANDTKGNRLPYRFGEKEVISSKGTAVPVWCYFPKNGTQSPTGEPNWYYYWSQTSASTGEHIYDPTIGTPVMGKYVYGETFFRVGHLARTSCGPGEQFKGIDCFARVCLHENNHLNDWWSFWPNGYDPEKDKDTTGAGIVTGDQIPDDLEVGLGYDPTRAHSYPPHRDFTHYSEPRSQQAEENWIMGSADYEDWAAPGKQFGGKIEE